VNLSQQQYQLFEEEFYKLNDLVIQPNLVIILKLNSDCLLQNIQKRNRNAESLISIDYLVKVNDSYSSVYRNLNSIPLIEFNLTENNDKTYQVILNEIISIISGGIFTTNTFNL
jgi:deoxyadenosine/deoxycytidine kinase